jgi:hypothetical protein
LAKPGSIDHGVLGQGPDCAGASLIATVDEALAKLLAQAN